MESAIVASRAERSRLLQLAVLLVCAPCVAGCDARTPRGGDTSAGAVARALDPVAIERSATRDLTGDGVPERLVVTATGTRFDSMPIQLQILDGRAGARLYLARWSSRDYFKYEPAGGQPDSAAARERITRRNVDRILSDSAFIPPRVTLADGSTATVDTGVVRYHLLELDWRRAHGLPDTMPIPREAEEQLGRQDDASGAERARAAAVAAELRGRPTFTYHEGGELTYTIVWSDREHAFVRVFSCC
ncbi:MAG: hypothetical protein JWL95_2734 [Gemmatimonadetes bacterium]|nr:hypothetical protein [Gemmatimonadota bacterium]